MPSSPVTGSVVGDFNRDGKLDLAGPGQLALGNGDGTFRVVPGVVPPAGQWFEAIAGGDINGDGKLDLVVGGATKHLMKSNGDWGNYYVTDKSYINVFLGHGDGTFGAPSTTQLSVFDIGPIEVADFNGDGRGDVLSKANDRIYLQTGRADGTLA